MAFILAFTVTLLLAPGFLLGKVLCSTSDRREWVYNRLGYNTRVLEKSEVI